MISWLFATNVTNSFHDLEVVPMSSANVLVSFMFKNKKVPLLDVITETVPH